jgi:hypothetical protein
MERVTWLTSWHVVSYSHESASNGGQPIREEPYLVSKPL